MDNWERFNETSLPNKESFYSSLIMKNIDDIDYRHGNNVFKRFKLKNLGEYHDLYVQSDTLLLADVFKNFRKTCLEVYELDPAHFLSLPGLAWQACLKKTFVICIIKKKYVVHIKSLKQALNHGLKLKNIHRIIEFNQKAWLKSYIDMNTELRKLAKDDFEKDLFKLMNNAVFGKTMENIRKHRDIKLLTTDKKKK